MEIRWSPEAAEDPERVLRHIQRDNLTAARKVADTIYTGVANLEHFPNRGRTGRCGVVETDRRSRRRCAAVLIREDAGFRLRFG